MGRHGGQTRNGRGHARETKLICGRPHVKLPCWRCGELIWTRAGNERAVCTLCHPPDRRTRGYGIGREPRSDGAYNGE